MPIFKLSNKLHLRLNLYRVMALVVIVVCLIPVQPLFASVTCQTHKSLSVPTEYQKIAEATGGSVFRFDKGEMGQLPANLLIDITPREHLLKLTKVFLQSELIFFASFLVPQCPPPFFAPVCSVFMFTSFLLHILYHRVGELSNFIQSLHSLLCHNDDK